ncbi:MAG TPA: hypothetical protein VK911_01230 [Vicinamibacterales bacterium]|nr:hypothetical protein [Vicinamibacterales bacterium]
MFVLRPGTAERPALPGGHRAGPVGGGALLVTVDDVTPIVLALAAAGLEVADAPRYYVQGGRKTADGETVN